MGRFDQTAHIGYKIAVLRVWVVLLNLKDIGLKSGLREDQLRNRQGEWNGGLGSVVAVRRTQTGNPKIDAKTDQILDIMKDVIQDLGPGRGSTYGIEIHMACANELRRLDLPGIGTHGIEQSFSAGDVVRYGLDGSIRTDIVLRNGRMPDAPIIAVWDIKTGNARLSPARVKEIRGHLGIADSIPVLELHVRRRVNVKYHIGLSGIWTGESADVI